jgi:predicted Rossmann fold nucleotide-binding protein DprA/Smf involved in DNA uptake
MTARPPLRVISGGQTGVDRAALDAALGAGFAVGGWCPAGRWAESGPIPPHYPLRETASAGPAERTRLNVRDSDATLVLAPGPPAGGTALTVRLAEAMGRPVRVLDPKREGVEDATRWLAALGRPLVLNVAGPRESEAPGVYAAALAWLADLFARVAGATS